MATENHTDHSVPLALAIKLLTVCGDAFHHGDDPENAGAEDVAAAIRTARENVESVLKAGFESQTSGIFDALNLMVLAESYLIAGSTLRSPSCNSPIRGTLWMATRLIEDELESLEGKPAAAGEKEAMS